MSSGDMCGVEGEMTYKEFFRDHDAKHLDKHRGEGSAHRQRLEKKPTSYSPSRPVAVALIAV